MANPWKSPSPNINHSNAWDPRDSIDFTLRYKARNEGPRRREISVVSVAIWKCTIARNSDASRLGPLSVSAGPILIMPSVLSGATKGPLPAFNHFDIGVYSLWLSTVSLRRLLASCSFRLSFDSIHLALSRPLISFFCFSSDTYFEASRDIVEMLFRFNAIGP